MCIRDRSCTNWLRKPRLNSAVVSVAVLTVASFARVSPVSELIVEVRSVARKIGSDRQIIIRPRLRHRLQRPYLVEVRGEFHRALGRRRPFHHPRPLQHVEDLSLIHISEPTRLLSISYA